ncbi:MULTISPECIES: hypothetical protein [unclassified Aureispira]|uniref:hypothetical protein n=1 Tax=unclassified Aureispira TaxID=2649989 RepID=UPI0006975C1F|nr:MULTISPECIES: hypothetical protein [unclassified Aureispira]WMX13205.1 hypothetical protein QP953_20385 [Aureispira sp. CCB-E]WMX17062.1 hypothetical protein QP953_11830 [Aureispira sp. CCB-E]WMX17165.1 hypothetical protein QP953_12345 [Aureispira sp. CCB-E]
MAQHAQFLTKFHQFSIYDLLDRKASLEKIYDLMEIYQRKWLRTHKRGGMVSSVHDVLQAILSLMPRTMEAMKTEQPNVFDWSIHQQEFFCFANNEYLATMVNQQAARPLLQISGRTVRSCIQKLLEAKILVQKVNFMHTGKAYPLPMHEDPRGRGKFKLILNYELLVWGEIEANEALGSSRSDAAQPLDAADRRTSFPQMSILDNIDTLKQYNTTPTGVVDKASASAELNHKIISGAEQGSKSISNCPPNLLPNNFVQKVFIPSSNKEDFLARQLFEQARVALWGGKNFNVAQTEQAVDLLRSHLRLVEDHVRLFRKQKLEQFKDSAYFKGLAKNPKYQWKMLNEWFAKKLPNIELSALRIVSEAIQKQRENALKNDYMDKIFAPTQYFISKHWDRALGYSKDDFNTIYTKFSPKNRSLSYYQMVMEQINQAHTSALQALQDGKTPYAMRVTEKAWRKLRGMIAQAPPCMSAAQKQKLIRKFKDRLQPIFSNQLS